MAEYGLHPKSLITSGGMGWEGENSFWMAAVRPQRCGEQALVAGRVAEATPMLLLLL